MNNNTNTQLTEIDECCLNGNKWSKKFSFNQKTQKILDNFSKLGIPQFFRRSTYRVKKTEPINSKRPTSMYIEDPSSDHSSLDQYMHDSTILMALNDTENKLLESEKNKCRLESKIETLEKDICHLQKENHQYIIKERSFINKIQELERKLESKDAEIKEKSFNGRIKEMELSSEIASLSHKLSNIETEKQERKIQKIMDCQSRIMEQTLPYTASIDNIYDNEDGLFNNILFDEILREQSQTLDEGNTYRKLSAQGIDEDNNFHNLILNESEITFANID